MVVQLENSTDGWHELINGKMCNVSYVVNIKSKEKELLCTVPNLTALRITKDDGKMKPAAVKV